MSWKTNESVIDNKNNRKSVANHRANVEDIADIVKNIGRRPATIWEYYKRGVYINNKNGKDLEVDFEKIMNENSSDEEVLSDDTGFASVVMTWVSMIRIV